VLLGIYVFRWPFMSFWCFLVDLGAIFRVPAVLDWFRAICDLLRAKVEDLWLASVCRLG